MPAASLALRDGGDDSEFTGASISAGLRLVQKGRNLIRAEQSGRSESAKGEETARDLLPPGPQRRGQGHSFNVGDPHPAYGAGNPSLTN